MDTLSVYRGRTRTGCLACRASKVKCDEQSPTCRRCVRQRKECVYTSRRTLHALPEAAENIAKDQTSETPSVVDISSHDSIQYEDSQSPAHTLLSQDICTTSPSMSRRSPSLLANLISQNILICTTIDLLAANEVQPSFTVFEQQVDHPFITPYDPANWKSFKLHAVEIASHNSSVATGILAVQSCFQARRLALSHTRAISLYTTGWEVLDSAVSSADDDQRFDMLLMTISLLCLVEVLVPGEIYPHLLDQSHGPLAQQLREWSCEKNFQSSLSLRLASWMLITHAAARRSGNQGLLCTDIRELFERTCDQAVPLPLASACCGTSSNALILMVLTEPLFTFYFRLQTLSTRVSDLSHYHRNRTTGEDQEEVSSLMAELKSQMTQLWNSRPTLLHHQREDLYAQFTSPAIADPLVLLVTLCCLTYHTELVELGRNLSAEQAPSAESMIHLAHIRSILSSGCGMAMHPSFLRSLFLYAIESPSEADSTWAVSRIQQIKDPVYYSKFFANFAKGLSDKQRQKGRRVTTRWWCLKEFGIDAPYL